MPIPKDSAMQHVTMHYYFPDLKSTNGTFLNGRRVADSCYIELKHADIEQI